MNTSLETRIEALEREVDLLSLLAHQDSPGAPRIRRRIVELPSEDLVVTTVINFEEQMRGWMAELSRTKSFQAEIRIYARLQDHVATYRRMTVLGFDEDAALFAKQLRSRRLSIGTME